MKKGVVQRLVFPTALAGYLLLQFFACYIPKISDITSGQLFQTADLSKRENSRIFFHETGGKGFLNMEQTCCVESAAFHNPSRRIVLFISEDASRDGNSVWREILTNYRNVKIEYIDYYSYFKGTPVENWYRNGSWITSPYKVAHLSDYLRVVSALKRGGLYLDLDMLVLRPLAESLFWNFLIFESQKNLIANAFFHLERNHPLLEELVRLLASEYVSDNYIYHGPEAFTKAVKRYCNITTRLIQLSKCKKIKILPNRMMDPFGPYMWDIYFQPLTSQAPLERVFQSFTFHHFRSVDNVTAISMSSNQLLGVLARKNCPFTVKKSMQ